MKKTFLSIIVLTTLSFGAFAQNVNIPDANFKAYLVANSNINTNTDAEIQISEASAFAGTISCENKNISDLTGIEAFTSITGLYCGFNNLSSLDLSNNTALEKLFCGSNNLDSLDISNNTLLDYLRLDVNNITSLDVSNNVNIAYLRFNGNNISNIDLSKNIALTDLICYGSSLSVLDLHSNIALTYLAVAGNDLNILNLANGNNSNMTSFSAANNPNLTCIDVDDVAFSTTNWTNIDAGVSYSLNCQVDLVTSISVQGQGGASAISTQGGTLQMEANVLPTYADDDTYTWSVINGTGSASISASGLLTSITNGTVTVTVIANDGSGVTGTATITLSNQNVGMAEVTNNFDFSLYPNPVKSVLSINSKVNILSVELIDAAGKSAQDFSIQNNSIDVSHLTKGFYIIQIKTEAGLVSKKFIKE